MTIRAQDNKAFAVWVNKEQKSEGAQNDVKRNSAFERVKAIMGDIQDKQKPLQETMDKLRESLEEVGESGQKLTKGQETVIKSLNSQLKEMLNTVKDLVQNLDQQAQGVFQVAAPSNEGQDFGEGSQEGGSGSGDQIAITSGFQVEAQTILAQLQAEFAQLTAIYNQMRENTVRQSTAMVSTLAAAAQDAGIQEANSDKADAMNSWAQFGSSGANLGGNAYNAKQVRNEIAAPQNRIIDMNKFQADLKAAPHANGIIGAGEGAPRPPQFNDLTADQKSYIARIKAGDFSNPTTLTPAQKTQALAYVNGDANAKSDIMKTYHEKMSAANSEVSSVYSRYQSRDAQLNSGTQMFSSGMSAGMNAKKAGYATAKGADDAVRSTAQFANDQNNQQVNELGQQAEGAKKEAETVLQIRSAIQQYNEAK